MEGIEEIYEQLGRKCLENINSEERIGKEVKSAEEAIISKYAKYNAGDPIFVITAKHGIEIKRVEVLSVEFFLSHGGFRYVTELGRFYERSVYGSEEEALEAMQAFINTRKG